MVTVPVALASARSAPPRQQLACDPHARPDLAREVLLAQPDLAALAPRELGGRLQLGHGLCSGWSRLGFGCPPRAGLARELAALVLPGCLGSTRTRVWRGLPVDAHLAQPEPLSCAANRLPPATSISSAKSFSADHHGEPFERATTSDCC